jgi:hypothetical protein
MDMPCALLPANNQQSPPLVADWERRKIQFHGMHRKLGQPHGTIGVRHATRSQVNSAQSRPTDLANPSVRLRKTARGSDVDERKLTGALSRYGSIIASTV